MQVEFTFSNKGFGMQAFQALFDLSLQLLKSFLNQMI